MSPKVTTGQGQQGAAPLRLKSYAKELGWQRCRVVDGTEYSGWYRVNGTLKYQGYVWKTSEGRRFFYIKNPPIALLRLTEFGACFHPDQGEWWSISFKPGAQPKNLDSGVAAIQKTLAAAFDARRKQRSRS